MNPEFKASFQKKWNEYFPGVDLPIISYYSNDLKEADFPDQPKPNKKGYTCIFSQLATVRRGRARAFNQDNLGCWGARVTLGFGQEISQAEKDYTLDFLVNVERFRKSEEIALATFAANPPLTAKGRYIVFKRWDLLSREDRPQVVSFFGKADTMAGLLALANYDRIDPHGVMVPFGSGCDSMIGFPMKELESDEPRAVLGGLDPGMRVCIKPDLLVFSVPWPRFRAMVENMDECFLSTTMWEALARRMEPLKQEKP